MRQGWLGAAGMALALGTAACGQSKAHSSAPPVTIPPTPASVTPASSPPVTPSSASPSPSATATTSSTPSTSASATPTPTAGGRCRESQLALSFGMGQGGVGHVGTVLVLHNTSAVSCVLYGYVGARLDAANRTFLPTKVVRGGGYLYQDPGPHQVTLAPGGTASAGLEWDHVPSPGDPNPCPTSTYLEVTPPNSTHYLFAKRPVQACNHGTLTVTALQAGSQGPA